MRTARAIVLLVLVQGIAGCGSPSSSWQPTPTPTPIPQPVPTPTSNLSVFTDAASGFSTTDVRDAQEHIVQFSLAGELIWTADGTRFREFSADGNLILAEAFCNCWFQVRFGTKDGQKRAYLTADNNLDNPRTVVALEVASGVLTMTQTDAYPPGTDTLSGVVSEAAPAGPVLLEGIVVSRGSLTGWQSGTTDKNGFYRIQGLSDDSDYVVVQNDGYEPVKVVVSIKGDTRFDIQLVRR